MPDPLTAEDIATLGSLLNDHGDRTAFYLHYYELTGNEQVAAMAQISHLTDFEGAVAAHANEAVESKFPDQYPAGGVFEFSKEIPPYLYDAIVADINAGGTGLLSERQVLEAAREAWDARGLGDQFPGNAPLAVERALDGDVKSALSAFDSEGTEFAINGAIYSIIPDISGAPPEGSTAPFIEDPERYSYHLTENEKFGFFVDRETGMFAGVFDRLTEGEPEIESRGVLNAVSSEPVAPTMEDVPASSAQSDEAAIGFLLDAESTAADAAAGQSFTQAVPPDVAGVPEELPPNTWLLDPTPTESAPVEDPWSFGLGTAESMPDLTSGSVWEEPASAWDPSFTEPTWPSPEPDGQSQDSSFGTMTSAPTDSGSEWGGDAGSSQVSAFPEIGIGDGVWHHDAWSDSGTGAWENSALGHGGSDDSMSNGLPGSTHSDTAPYGGDTGSHGSSSSDSSGSTFDSTGSASSGD